MKAAHYDFVFEKNTDWNFSIGYNTGNINSYTPVNITGYLAEFKLYENRYSEPVLIYTSMAGNITILPAEGKFEFNISRSVNSEFTAREMYYTFEITDPGNKTERILKGAVRIEV
jgi:hypothetical protein